MKFAHKFWSLVDKTANGCWLWKGSLTKSGYGQIRFQKKMWRVHRLAWFLTFKTLPKLNLLHSCDARNCVNPSHLREGTQAENMQDMRERGRQAKGESSGNHKLSELDVLIIRNLIGDGFSNAHIARKFNITRFTVRDIKVGKTWRNVSKLEVISEH